MLHPCQVAAPFQVLNARNNIAFFFVPFDGTLKRIDLAVAPANANAGGDSVFDVKLNGVTIFGSPTDRPKIVASAAKGNVAGLAVAVTEGDIISFDATSIPAGGLQGPVMLQALIDDNITGGLDTAAVNALIAAFAAGGDLSGTLGAAVVEQLKGRSLAGIPDIPGFFGDNFNDNSINMALWTVTSGVTESSGRLNVPTGDTATSALTMDVTGHYFIFKVNQTADGFFRLSFNGGTYFVEVRCQTQALGRIRLTTHDPTNGDIHNDYFPASGADWAWLRLRHDSGANHWLLDVAPDVSGAPGAWTNEVNANAPTGAPTYTTATPIVIGQGGAFWIDEISSNAPTSDPISGADGYAILWNQTAGHYVLAKVLAQVMSGVEGVLGAPAPHTISQCEFHYDRVAQRLKIWNDDLGQWDYINVDGHD